MTERFAEFVLVIALMGPGLKIDRVFAWRRWDVTWRLPAITKPLGIPPRLGLRITMAAPMLHRSIDRISARATIFERAGSMRRLSDTIARLGAATTGAASAYAPAGSAASAATGLDPLEILGANPGALKGWVHVPAGHADMPLVVVLHGCTQTAAGYDLGSGWSAIADRFGFALLFPEQQRANNPNLCFNWFLPDDIRRDSGEALSIREMIRTVTQDHSIDPARVFVTGLSAGGAMAAVMLATYPEVFAGGAIIAGLPYGAAASVSEALERMRGQGLPSGTVAGGSVEAASAHSGPWPAVSIWHGEADRTVSVANADAILDQWRAVHRIDATPDVVEDIGVARRRSWRDSKGRVCLRDYRIPGLGHGTPLGLEGDTACGTPMPYMLAVGLSSTWHIAADWGLLGKAAARATARATGRPRADPAPAATVSVASGVQATIEAALRSAGLMR